MVLSLRTKQVLMAIGGVVAALLLAAAYYAYQLTRHDEPGLLNGATDHDAKEVSKKLKLLADAATTGKRGFVRLSELEINSFLNSNYNNSLPVSTNARAATVRSFIDLSRKNVVWYDVVRKPILGGKSLDFLWERTVALEHQNGKWTFQVKAMRVGDVDVPQKLWAEVETFFEGADEKFDDRIGWIASLPALELTQNELSLQPELRLYNYNPKATGKP